jgi:hemerythrin-like metal-binding protein
MQKIEWNDQFSVGIAEMDFQHQKIANLLNTLVDHALEDARSEKISEALMEMVEYASEHFRCEEELLRTYAYTDLAQQQRAHRQFRRQVGEFCVLVAEGDEQVVCKMLEFLRDWWANHILNEDKKYSAILEK